MLSKIGSDDHPRYRDIEIIIIIIILEQSRKVGSLFGFWNEVVTTCGMKKLYSGKPIFWTIKFV